MAESSESANDLKAALAMPDRVAQAQKKIDPVFKDLSTKVPAAIKDGDQEMIAYYLKAMRVELNNLSTALQDIRIGLNTLKQIEEDEDFLADHLAEVEKATKTLSEARTNLTHQYESVKELENDAEKASKSPKVSKDEFFDEVAKYDKFLTGDLKHLAEAVKVIETAYEKAFDAVDVRDARMLAEAQKTTREADVQGDVDLFQDRENELKGLLKKIDDQKFDAKDAATLKDAVNDLLVRQGKARPDIRDLQKYVEEVLGLKIVQIDVKKALKVLELDAKAEAKLTKVLKGPPSGFEKGLDALAKELKLKTNGKAMLAELKKAGVV